MKKEEIIEDLRHRQNDLLKEHEKIVTTMCSEIEKCEPMFHLNIIKNAYDKLSVLNNKLANTYCAISALEKIDV